MSIDQLQLTRFDWDPKKATRQEWDMFHDLRREQHEEFHPEDPLTPNDIVETQMTQDNPFGENFHHLVVDGDVLVASLGGGIMNPNAPGYENNKHVIWGGAGVRKEYRRRGIASSLILKVISQMEHWDRTTFITGTDNDQGRGFLEWLGAQMAQSMAENRLDIEAVDWDMIDRWINEGAERSPDSKLELFEDRLPAEFLDEYCPVYSRLVNMAPRDELDMGDFVATPEVWEDGYEKAEKLGRKHHTMVTREPDGAISGLTEIYYRPDKEAYLYQNLTGVMPEYRGRGLGKWLKAAMLKWAKEKYPAAKWMVTGNAHSNDPMLAINTKLGFKEHRSGMSYQITLDQLKTKAAQLSI